jgi:hypothetical protein
MVLLMSFSLWISLTVDGVIAQGLRTIERLALLEARQGRLSTRVGQAVDSPCRCDVSCSSSRCRD